MVRPRLVLWSVLTVAMAGVAVPGIAHAGPPPPCSFILTAPQVVHVDGADMVTATLTPADCDWPAEPASSVACLHPHGAETPTTCAQSNPAGIAHVHVPYVPGSTYEATARGCGAWVGQPPAPDCQILGPQSATL